MRSQTLFSFFVTGLLVIPGNAGAAQRSTERSFQVAPNSRLEMQVSGGDILIQVWERSEVSVRTTGADESGLTLEQLGDTVSVKYEGRQRGWENAEFRVNVPGSLNIDLQTGGGDVAIEGDLTGRLHAKSGGGDITFDGVEGGIEIKSSGGDIRGGNVGADLSIESMGGDIQIGSVAGMAEVESMGGDIQLDRVGASLKTRTMGGDVEVGDVNGSAEITSQGGDVLLGRVVNGVTVKTAGGDIKVEAAEGNAEIRTAGGDIQLENIVGSIEAETAGGDIEVTLSPQGEASSMVSAGGDVTLTIPGGVNATVEASIQLGGRWGSDEYSIQSDFEAEGGSEIRNAGNIRAVYQINGGGPRITLKTSSGNIRIQKGSAER